MIRSYEIGVLLTPKQKVRDFFKKAVSALYIVLFRFCGIHLFFQDDSSALFSLDAKGNGGDKFLWKLAEIKFPRSFFYSSIFTVGGECEFLQLPYDVPLTPYRDGVGRDPINAVYRFFPKFLPTILIVGKNIIWKGDLSCFMYYVTITFCFANLITLFALGVSTLKWRWLLVKY